MSFDPITAILDVGGKLIEKACLQCKIKKPASEYYKRNGTVGLNRKSKYSNRRIGDGYRCECKVCFKQNQKTRYENRPPGENKNRFLKWKYGITIAEYDSILESQNNACAICGSEITGKGGLDHCHATGKIRGVLCAHCNAAIGHMNDDIERLRKAISYLERNGDINGV